jgi:hypothetical protein
MKLVAVVRAVAHPEEAARALAAASGLTLAEARMRLAPEPPALVARLEPEDARRLVGALRDAGVAALAVDVHCPTDEDRTLVQRFALEDGALTLSPRDGEPLVLAWPEVATILRGTRAARSETERTEKSQRFSVGAALATGGLKLTRTSTKVVRSSEESIEQVILVYARDGRAATLAETRLELSCLGAAMQPSSTANMVELARRLREKATRAFYDERLVRLGRRTLPFLPGDDWRSRSSTTVTSRSDTSGTLDVLAEIVRQAAALGLLP